MVARLFSELGSEEKAEDIARVLELVPQIDLYQKEGKIVFFPFVFESDTGGKGYFIMRYFLGENTIGEISGAIELDVMACDSLLRALLDMRKMFRQFKQIKLKQMN